MEITELSKAIICIQVQSIDNGADSMRSLHDSTTWQLIDTAPKGVLIETMICDHLGVRNIRNLSKSGSLWFAEDGTYMYYDPTHWRAIAPSPEDRPIIYRVWINGHYIESTTPYRELTYLIFEDFHLPSVQAYNQHRWATDPLELGEKFVYPIKKAIADKLRAIANYLLGETDDE